KSEFCPPASPPAPPGTRAARDRPGHLREIRHLASARARLRRGSWPAPPGRDFPSAPGTAEYSALCRSPTQQRESADHRREASDRKVSKRPTAESIHTAQVSRPSTPDQARSSKAIAGPFRSALLYRCFWQKAFRASRRASADAARALEYRFRK